MRVVTGVTSTLVLLVAVAGQSILSAEQPPKVASVPASPESGSRLDDRDLFEQGHQKELRGDYAGALELYRKVSRVPLVQYRIAVCLAEVGVKDDAILALKRFLTDNEQITPMNQIMLSNFWTSSRCPFCRRNRGRRWRKRTTISWL